MSIFSNVMGVLEAKLVQYYVFIIMGLLGNPSLLISSLIPFLAH